jgi:hypothetical protein
MAKQTLLFWYQCHETFFFFVTDEEAKQATRVECTNLGRAPEAVFATLHFLLNLDGQLAILLNYSRLEMLVGEKQSNFLDQFVSYAKNEVL